MYQAPDYRMLIQTHKTLMCVVAQGPGYLSPSLINLCSWHMLSFFLSSVSSSMWQYNENMRRSESGVCSGFNWDQSYRRLY